MLVLYSRKSWKNISVSCSHNSFTICMWSRFPMKSRWVLLHWMNKFLTFSHVVFGRTLSQMTERLASFVSMRQGILYESQRLLYFSVFPFWIFLAYFSQFILMRCSLLLWQITEYLEQKCYKELRNGNIGSVKVVLCIYKKLLSSCKEQM